MRVMRLFQPSMKLNKKSYFLPLETPIGKICFIFSKNRDKLIIHRLFLRPVSDLNNEFLFCAFSQKDCNLISSNLARLFEYGTYDREKLSMDLSGISELDLNILRVVSAIPRGSVKTYREVAGFAGIGSARYVGSVMSRNRLPLFIPCHRVVRSDGHIGMYGGGIDMKRALLLMEGVKIRNYKYIKEE